MLHLAISPETCERVFSVTRSEVVGVGVMYTYGHWLYSRMFLCSFGSVFQFTCPPLLTNGRIGTREHLAYRAHLNFTKAYQVNSCDIQPLHPTPHLKVTVGNLHLTRASLFRIHLLVGLERLGSEWGLLEVQPEISRVKSSMQELRMRSILSLLAPVWLRTDVGYLILPHLITYPILPVNSVVYNQWAHWWTGVLDWPIFVGNTHLEVLK